MYVSPPMWSMELILHEDYIGGETHRADRAIVLPLCGPLDTRYRGRKVIYFEGAECNKSVPSRGVWGHAPPGKYLASLDSFSEVLVKVNGQGECK